MGISILHRAHRNRHGRGGLLRAGLAGALLAALAPGLGAKAADLASKDLVTKAPAAPPAKEWQVIVSPYLWGASLNGTAGVLGYQRDVDVPFSDTLENLDFGLMGAVEVTNGAIGFFLNAEYVNISNEQTVAGVPLDIGSTTTIVATGAYFTLLKSDLGGTNLDGSARTFSLSPLAGVRWTKLSTDLGIGPLQLSSSQSWFDPFVGAQINVDLSDRWNFTIEGDVGGFGVGSELALNGQAYIGYRTKVFGYNTMWRAGYRALYQDYKNGGFTWDMTQHGPVLGASISF